MSITSYNNRIIDVLQEIQTYYEGTDEFRSIAYAKAIFAIRQYNNVITSGEQARTIHGIGISIGNKIDEILSTGTCEKLNEIRSNTISIMTPTRDYSSSLDINKANILESFSKIYGVGPVTSENWYNKGYRSYSDIPYNECTTAQSIGLKYVNEYTRCIPRAGVEYVENVLRKWISDYCPNGITLDISGSYRRGAETCGDIDVLITTKLEGDAISFITSNPIFTDSLASGSKSYMGICQVPYRTSEGIVNVHHRIDVKLFNPDEYIYALLYFTGSKHLNIMLRDIAKSKGLILNDTGLWYSDNPKVRYPCLTERDIFKTLGVEYIQPLNRNI